MNEQECLYYDPFAGDRDCHVKVLADRFLTVRKSHLCTVCSGTVPSKARVRARTEVSYDERKVMTFYFCPLCCEAMANVSIDGGREIEERTAIGMRLSGML